MKRLLIILFCFISISLNATIYYIAPTTATPAGNDVTGNGSITTPWFSIEKAFYILVPGDTCYIRGGVYYYDNVQYHNVYGSTHDGTPSAHIYYINYPGERPIFDFSKYIASSEGVIIHGIYLYQTQYLEFEGITIRHLWQRLDNVRCLGFAGLASNYIKLTNCLAHDISGTAFHFHNVDSIMIYNSDAHDCRDTLRSDTFSGNGGGGFSIKSDDLNTQLYGYLYGCRAWNCSDEAFGGTNEGPEIYENCWAFCNGWAFPDCPHPVGQGWKFGFENTEYALKRIVNCVAAYNKSSGFNTNGVCRGFVAEWYNNTSYHNGSGFYIYNTTEEDEDELKRVLRNNITYKNSNDVLLALNATYTHDHNSWDIPLNLQPSDFVSLDSTGLTGARQADGSLPVLNFLKLSSTSAAIDAGTDVGLDYNNAAPDLGAYEYPTFDEAVVPYLNTTYPTFSWSMGITSGGNMLDAGGGTISRKGVCYSTSVNPTTSDNVVEGGTGTSDFTSKIWALKPNTTYHVRAFATNEYGTGYGADVTFTTPIRSFGVKNKKIIKLNGKIVII